MENIDFIKPGELEAYLQGRSCTAYEIFGVHKIARSNAYRFTVWAPHARSVSVVGDFNGWDPAAAPMERREPGVWTAVIPGVKKGQVYRYAVTHGSGHTVLKSDPYAFHWETGPATGTKVWSLGRYPWTDKDYMAARRKADPLKKPMNIYEVHVGSWRRKEGQAYPWYRDVADALAAYCLDMGYTHVELLPVTEYPYEPSWGYQVTGYFAPTSRYGTPQDFMYFVDKLHAAGIGVIMDWVPAHFPRDEYGLAYFDGTATYERPDPKMASHPDWGTLIFDYENPAVRSFLLSSAGLFLDKYHIDGLRVDAVSSILYLNFNRPDYTPNYYGGDVDLGAVYFLQELTDLVRSRGAVSIAEESHAYPGVTAARENGGLGFTFKWDMGFMHDTLDYMALDPVYRKWHHNKLTFSMMYCFSEHFILAFSHDEVVHGKKSMVDKMAGDYDQKFASLRALYGYQFAHPGKKHTFMGSEMGQFIEWDEKRELDWFLLDYPRHGEMARYCRELNHLYTSHPALYDIDDGWEGFTWLNVDDADRSSIAFLRTGKGGQRLICLCNFTPNTWEMRIGLPGKGTMKLLLSSDDFRFGGTGTPVEKRIRSTKEGFRDLPCSALVTLPPLSAVYYEFQEERKK
ncbi:MAG: 1,4-alpha-glucan branching protein GlgB [Oscillospiraceae bacterium]